MQSQYKGVTATNERKNLQVPNTKFKFTGKYYGKRRQKTIRVCDCCFGYDIKEYINRILESMIYLEEMNNYTEQIEQLKEETKKLQKLYRQTTEETPAYLEFLSDVIRANKILIHYLTIVDLPAS